jgi:hypothetical protein
MRPLVQTPVPHGRRKKKKGEKIESFGFFAATSRKTSTA